MTVSCETITSRQNRLVIETGKLCDRRERAVRRQFRLDGIKLVGEAVQKGITVRRILIAKGKADRMLSVLREWENSTALARASVHILSDDVFAKVSEERAPEGILAVADRPSFHADGDEAVRMLAQVSAEDSVLLLESVRDPGNVGTILRSAAAFGVRYVAISADCADLYNSKTIRGAMGALFGLHIASFSDITEAIALLRENRHRVFAAALDPDARKLAPSMLGGGDCVVIGNEGHGLLPTTVAACDSGLYIPMEEGSESLNAAIAASVILWSLYCGR